MASGEAARSRSATRWRAPRPWASAASATPRPRRNAAPLSAATSPPGRRSRTASRRNRLAGGARGRHHCGMAPRLLERDAPLGALLERARGGRGRARLDRARLRRGRDRQDEPRARVRRARRLPARGCCRPPATTSSRRARSVRCTTRRPGPTVRWRARWPTEDQVFTALLDELGEVPTVLIVEDAHWADDATLDVLGYVARRVESLPALLVLTLRDDAIDPGHPLHRLLGMLATGPVHRLELSPLSREAVGARAGRRHGPRRRRRARAHARQPVLRRRGAGGAAGRGPGERQGRRARARAAAERRLPRGARAALGAALDDPDRPRRRARRARAAGRGRDGGADRAARGRARVPARARAAGDRAEPAGDPPAAAQSARGGRAARAGAAGPRPAAASRGRGGRRRRRCSRRARRRRARRPARARTARRSRTSRRSSRTPARLEPRECAALLDDYGWELYNAHQFREAVEAAHEAERLYRELGEPVALALCLVRLSRHLFMAGATDAAEEAAQRAVVTLDGTDDEAALAHATLYLGAILALSRPDDASEILERADALALRSRRPDLAALCLNYLAIARVEAGEPDGPADDAQQHRARAGRRAPRGDRARLHEPRRAADAARAARRARALRHRGPDLHARARVLVARLQPRGPPLPAAAAPRRLGRRRGGPAAPARGRRRPGDALRLQRPVARPRARPPRRPDRRRPARRRVGAGAAPAPAARPGLRRDRARRVGVADRRPGAARAGRRRAAAADRAPGRDAVPRRAAALPGARGRAGRGRAAGRGGGGGAAAGGRRRARPRTTSACAATGGRPPRPGGAPATPTRPRSSWPRATPRTARRRCARSSGSARRPRPRSSARACATSAPRSRAARARPRGPTRPG